MKRFLLILLALIYTLFPFDLIPDLFFGPGWIDDLLVWIIVCTYLWFRQNTEGGARQDEDETGHASSGKEYDGTGNASAQAHAPKAPHEILGVRQNATPEEIRKAYRELANKYHPDKVAHLGEEFQTIAEIRFKEIQAAYRCMMPR
ncbi:hypothetical protein DENIS_4492 [Desulfonema ishimotonii]|uniref:J domain-containing protein n=1 Tax=Desulfonema ishimotonii TaxID=45657 RepID=A0A401G2M8_9BACT|nr:DnaJ domain-containing protein [Desulfonema ishimotonii]GBC63498.1 hypothetical protein DENIS_4492 [Desulfonema ishimotonii]